MRPLPKRRRVGLARRRKALRFSTAGLAAWRRSIKSAPKAVLGIAAAAQEAARRAGAQA